MDYNPAELPAIDAVEVVALRGVRANRVSTFMREANSVPSVRVTEERAQEIARLWRLLPADEPMRCHTPPFGLRFFCEGALHLQASICWECNNIFIEKAGQSLFYTFDGEHPHSQELLALLQRIMA